MHAFQGRVRYSECDDSGRLSLFSAMNYLQDCSTFQSAELGQGINGLESRGLAWVLSNWAIEVERLPRFGEFVRVSTWCYEMSHAHALRSFLLEGSSGEQLVRADSQWFVLDTATGHVTRVPQDQLVYLSDEPRLEMAPLARRIKVSGPATMAPHKTVKRYDLDTNHHVNNARYVRIATNALDALGIDVPLARIQVQYRTMALLDDVIVPQVHACEDGWDVDLTDRDGKTYAIVRLQK